MDQPPALTIRGMRANAAGELVSEFHYVHAQLTVTLVCRALEPEGSTRVEDRPAPYEL